jgi:hypothetical protein
VMTPSGLPARRSPAERRALRLVGRFLSLLTTRSAAPARTRSVAIVAAGPARCRPGLRELTVRTALSGTIIRIARSSRSSPTVALTDVTGLFFLAFVRDVER